MTLCCMCKGEVITYQNQMYCSEHMPVRSPWLYSRLPKLGLHLRPCPPGLADCCFAFTWS